MLVNGYFSVKCVFVNTAPLHLEFASRRKQTFRSEEIIIIAHRDCVIVQKSLITRHLQLVPSSYPKMYVSQLSRFSFHYFTFPEDWMPFITARQTIIQAASSDRVILQFRPPLSAIVLVMFRVSRYQKYVVAELFSHSGSTTNQTMENQRYKNKPMSINIPLTIWWLCGKDQIVFLRIWLWFIRLPL